MRRDEVIELDDVNNNDMYRPSMEALYYSPYWEGSPFWRGPQVDVHWQLRNNALSVRCCPP